ncbi:MAG TPA: serine hydrolase domain-containing protein, partial [Nannocystaceae bacterium]|nr:serine hydrolase domain-containing protein [Nannocystaceae bacterium]
EGFGVADENGTPADATTLFNMASVTKHITALTILSERDEGLVELDTPVPDIFPQFQVGGGFDPASVHVRHLLTHTSGLGDWPTEPYVGTDTLVDEFVLNPNQPLWFQPGTVHDYSNRGYTLAGLLAAQLHGGTFADAVQERVLDPLGMTTATVDAAVAMTRTHARGDSEWDGGWVGPEAYVGEWYMPSGGLWASANDLGALLSALANQSVSGFAEGTLAELGSPVQPTYEYPGAAYGYGLYNDGNEEPTLYHGGSTGGYLADLEVRPALGFGVAIVVNTNAWSPSQAGFAILDHYAGPIPYPQGTDLLDPSTIPGSYDDPWQLGHIDVAEGPNGLQASFTDKGVVRDLEELWPGFYACQHPSEDASLDIQFWPGQDGAATHFVSRAGVAARVQ